MKLLKDQSGFTLIELVLIIIVLGILSAVALVQFGNLQTSARDGAIDGAYGSFQSALAIALGECRNLPDSANIAGPGDGDCSPVGTDMVGDFNAMVFGRVTLTGGDLTALYTAGNPGTLRICSGTVAGGGRMATAAYDETATPPLATLGAKVAAAAPCP
jgi:prepilin-type N-terminal cleavage/methylation domain-containing protein